MGKPGWMEAGAVSCTVQPRTASMAMRPCLSSASRSTFTSNTSEKPRGSKPTSPGSEPSRLVGCLRKGTDSEKSPWNTAILGEVTAAHTLKHTHTHAQRNRIPRPSYQLSTLSTAMNPRNKQHPHQFPVPSPSHERPQSPEAAELPGKRQIISCKPLVRLPQRVRLSLLARPRATDSTAAGCAGRSSRAAPPTPGSQAPRTRCAADRSHVLGPNSTVESPARRSASPNKPLLATHAAAALEACRGTALHTVREDATTSTYVPREHTGGTADGAREDRRRGEGRGGAGESSGGDGAHCSM